MHWFNLLPDNLSVIEGWIKSFFVQPLKCPIRDAMLTAVPGIPGRVDNRALGTRLPLRSPSLHMESLSLRDSSCGRAGTGTSATTSTHLD